MLPLLSTVSLLVAAADDDADAAIALVALPSLMTAFKLEALQQHRGMQQHSKVKHHIAQHLA